MSRDVTWLHKDKVQLEESEDKFREWQNKEDAPLEIKMDQVPSKNFEPSQKLEGKENQEQEIQDDGEERAEEEEIIFETDDEDTDEEDDDASYQIKTRSATRKNLPRELRNLKTSYNPVFYTQVEQLDMLMMSIGGYDDPTTFEEAWNHDIPKEREGWRDAIHKELTDMHVKRSIWKKIPIQEVPKGRKLIGSKWVFKKKKNGVFRARLCALGYSQVPGVDFTENFAPVVNEVTLRLVLLKWMTNPKWMAKVYDVETAFLYGDLPEPIYMKIPKGLEHLAPNYKVETDCLLLKKSMYGLVQAARQWWKKFIYMLSQEFKFTRSHADACILFRTDQEGTIILCIYVDDALMIGDDEAITKTVKQLREKLSLKEVGELQEYVGCTILKSRKQNRLIMCQPDLLSKLEKTFKSAVEDMRVFKTPTIPGEIIIKTTDKDEIVDKSTHRMFRSGVGMLLYLIKYSRPDIGNAVREIAKVMDGPTELQVKSLYRLIKYVLDTKNQGLLMSPLEPEENSTWIMSAYCDSDYAGDKDGRKSVSGFVIYIQGCLISWKSRKQKSVTLSSSEAEYVAISEVCAEIMFLKQVVEFMEIKVKLPIIVKVDNVGAIYLANNAVSGPRMKHVDIRYHFVRDLIEEGIIEVAFVKSEENDSDVFTKNLGEELFKKHTKKFMTAFNIDGKGVT
jgi:Reverse transcriptase (RNA-dependent DNA polymerase)